MIENIENTKNNLNVGSVSNPHSIKIKKPGVEKLSGFLPLNKKEHHIATLYLDPEDFIVYRKALDNNALNFYYFLQTRFTKSIIYNWSYKRLSEITGLHRHTISGYVKFLLKIKYLRKEGNHLVIIRQEDFTKVKVYKSISWNDFKGLVKLKLLKINKQQREFIIDMKKIQQSEKSFFVSKSKARKFLKFKKKNRDKLVVRLNHTITYSHRSLAKLFNVSTGTVNKLLKEWESKGLIKTKRIIKLYKKDSSRQEYLQILKLYNSSSSSNKLFPILYNNNIYLHKGITINMCGYYGGDQSMFIFSTRKNTR